MIAVIEPLLDGAAQLGVAGLMGAMWLWERKTSQKREQQIDEAHTRILADQLQLDQLVDHVRGNTEMMSRLSGLQEQLLAQLRREGKP
jgi:hypothetical protein